MPIKFYYLKNKYNRHCPNKFFKSSKQSVQFMLGPSSGESADENEKESKSVGVRKSGS